MAMTPEERNEFNQMKATLQNLQRVEDVAFIENIKRRIGVDGTITAMIDGKLALVEINDLADVDTSGVSDGQVIKYNSSTETWENANDIDT